MQRRSGVLPDRGHEGGCFRLAGPASRSPSDPGPGQPRERGSGVGGWPGRRARPRASLLPGPEV